MALTSPDFAQPRVWLREIIRPMLDDLIANPLDMRRAYAALIVTYQYHERLFYALIQSHPKFAGQALVDFRRDIAAEALTFESLAAAADPAAGHTLKFTNILSADFLLGMLTNPLRVHRSIIVKRLNRQLIPLLEELIADY